MENPKTIEMIVDDVIYNYMFFDFGSFMRFDLYQNGKRVGYRKLPIKTDQGDAMVKYLIRRMVGNYGVTRKVISYKQNKLDHGGGKGL